MLCWGHEHTAAGDNRIEVKNPVPATRQRLPRTESFLLTANRQRRQEADEVGTRQRVGPTPGGSLGESGSLLVRLAEAMRVLFADTQFWIAICRPNDPWAKAAEDAITSAKPVRLVTTDEVLTELLTAMAAGGPHLRLRAAKLVDEILADPQITVVPQTRSTFLEGLRLYRSRPDKSYSLTDCVSMALMERRRISEVLTADRHFAQEGFSILFR